jgi:ankyrin repeat protein
LLLQAVEGGNNAIVKLLLDHGANIEAKDNDGCTIRYDKCASRDFLTHPFLYMITTPFFNEILLKQAQKKAFQYFIAPPLFLRHASHLLGTESQSFKRKFLSISGHITVNVNRISCIFLTLCLLLEIKSLMCF